LIQQYSSEEIFTLINSLEEWELLDSEFGISDSKFLIILAELTGDRRLLDSLIYKLLLFNEEPLEDSLFERLVLVLRKYGESVNKKVMEEFKEDPDIIDEFQSKMSLKE
jgi:hypothetical protein